ncbi:MAG: 50S ribosomal protein L3 N(5)-glutamine methyltransferase [Candidatus Dasytiphilus stammeri]
MNAIVPNKIISKLQSIQDILDWTISVFYESSIYYGHGTDNPWDEAIRLVLPTLWLPLNLPQKFYLAQLTHLQRQHIINRVMRRVKERIPVAYITNRAWFCNCEFYIDERVLIPRSPISELIEKKFVSLLLTKELKYILDIGTGSGCIAIACSYVFPNAIIHASDISLDALTVTEHNIAFHNLKKFVIPLCSDLFNDINHNKYDLIISNPPYVGKKQINNLPPEYGFEPKIGLMARMEGLEIIHRILLQASDYLNNNGILICEVGYHQQKLIEKYPNIPFLWLEFERGGSGVFMLTKKQLIKSQKYISLSSV